MIRKSSKYRCATCTNKESIGNENYKDIGYFYATDKGVMRCIIDGKLISMEIYHKLWYVGYASHSAFNNEE